MVNGRVVVHCLSEDGGKGVRVICILVRRTLVRIVEPKANAMAIAVEPYDREHGPAVVANAWLSSHPRDQAKISALNRYIARLLSVDDGRFRLVFHHFDADVSWRDGRTCTKLDRWGQVVYAAVARLVGEESAKRLLPLVPHPEVESWLYANAETLTRLANDQGRSVPVPPPGGWDACAGVKDEHVWPRDVHNDVLADALPVKEVARASPSYAQLLMAIEAVPGAIQSLHATRD